jgi:fatty-acyl-CoA synthase
VGESADDRTAGPGATGATLFNLAEAFDTVAGTIPDTEAVVGAGKRLTYAQLADRSNRLASYLHGRGLRLRTERDQLAGHESGQDHVGLYLYTGSEYLEGMLGSYKARLAPFNVNYRYVEEELRYLLNDAKARALVYHACFAPTLAAILPDLPDLDVLLQVDDGSGQDLLPGAVDYEAALAGAPASRPPVETSPDDLYVLYTGGTTGMPKGVLWRQHDIFMNAMGGRSIGSWEALASYEDLAAKVAGGGLKLLLLPPLMHGAAQWAGFIFLNGGGTLVLPDDVTRMDPADVLRTLEREGAHSITVVGDAILRPLVDEIERGDYDLSSLLGIGNGGAPLSSGLKERLLGLLPSLFISDAAGASETGAQMSHLSTAGSVSTGTFTPGPGATVVTAEVDALAEPGQEELGWLAQGGWVPLGYLNDAEKSARTFPVIDGIRYAVPGDRARLRADGSIELLGRDAVTINSGGEKIFAEEVEQAFLHHPDVADVVVAGRPSERWGQEVVAVVQLADDSTATADDLLDEAARHIARYKLPKAIVLVPLVVRSPSGKADYRWARDQAAGA